MTTPDHPAASLRKRTPWTVGAIAAVAVVGIGAFAIPALLDGSQPATHLTQPGTGGPAAICAEVTDEALADADSAVSAKVTGIEGDTVTLEVVDRYRGDVEDTITTTQGDGSGVDGAPLVLLDDQTYLLAERDGQILTCGISSLSTPELKTLYQQAFEQ